MKTLGLLILLLAFCIPTVSAAPLSAAENRALLIASQRSPDLQRDDSAHYRAYQKLLYQSIKSKSVVSAQDIMEMVGECRVHQPVLAIDARDHVLAKVVR